MRCRSSSRSAIVAVGKITPQAIQPPRSGAAKYSSVANLTTNSTISDAGMLLLTIRAYARTFVDGRRCMRRSSDIAAMTSSVRGASATAMIVCATRCCGWAIEMARGRAT
jgi:hypothetical protein